MVERTVENVALQPLRVLGVDVTTADLIEVAMSLANAPHAFIAMDLVGSLPDHGWHWKQEVINRLLQRWRKLGLVAFKTARWTMSNKAWGDLQSAALRAREATHAR